MEYNEALETIKEILAMFSSFAEEIENLPIGRRFLTTPVFRCDEEDGVANKRTYKMKSKLYYNYDEGNMISKRFIADIRPVCSCMVNEWPSPKSKRIRKSLLKAYIECLDYCKAYIDESWIDVATDYVYCYHSRYNTSVLDNYNIEKVMLDTIYEMNQALDSTEEDEQEVEEQNVIIAEITEDLGNSTVCPIDYCIKQAIMQLKKDRVIKNKYDYAFIMMAMNDTEELPTFNSSSSFLNYLKELKIDELPSVDSIKKMYSTTIDHYPLWKFTDKKGKDATEAKQRIEVAKTFISLSTKEK